MLYIKLTLFVLAALSFTSCGIIVGYLFGQYFTRQRYLKNHPTIRSAINAMVEPSSAVISPSKRTAVRNTLSALAK